MPPDERGAQHERQTHDQNDNEDRRAAPDPRVRQCVRTPCRESAGLDARATAHRRNGIEEAIHAAEPRDAAIIDAARARRHPTEHARCGTPASRHGR